MKKRGSSLSRLSLSGERRDMDFHFFDESSFQLRGLPEMDVCLRRESQVEENIFGWNSDICVYYIHYILLLLCILPYKWSILKYRFFLIIILRFRPQDHRCHRRGWLPPFRIVISRASSSLPVLFALQILDSHSFRSCWKSFEPSFPQAQGQRSTRYPERSLSSRVCPIYREKWAPRTQ